MILHRPGPLQTAKPPCGPRRARCRGLLDGVGAGRCATRGNSEELATLCLRFFAGCRLARGRSAPRRLPRAWGADASRDADLSLRLLEVGLPMGCCTAAGFKILPPPRPVPNFSCAKFTFACSVRSARNVFAARRQPAFISSSGVFVGNAARCTTLIYEVVSCQIKFGFGKDAVSSTITRCKTSSASRYASSSHASSARSVLPCKCAAAQVVPPPRWATTKPPKDY